MPQSETEADTRANRIDPVLRDAGWGVVEGSRIGRETMISPGRIVSASKRANPAYADYVLHYRGQQLAVMEAKRAGLSYTEGVGQAKDYAKRLGTRFAYATNGLKYYEIDMETSKERDVPTVPSPGELWHRCYAVENEWRNRFGKVPFETGGGKWEPRYYQHKAIQAALEAIAAGQKRILLTLATGTGKTSIAFQIAWKLYQSKWNNTGADRRPRILFLADRNILANQAFNAFSAFPDGVCTRVSPGQIRKKGKVPTNANIFFTIFQTFMTGDGRKAYEDYPPDFFDFIIIDECHRGGANDESSWRDIMEHFSGAYQLGLTATPKRDVNGDTYDYFGEPVYVYSLKDGIEDGFLTPFKVRHMQSTIDEYVYDPTDELVKGEIDPEKEYKEADFNRRIVIEEREKSRVTEFMREIDPKHKTLVFCATQDHALRVRDFINQIKVVPDPDYCHRVTSDDGKIGEQHLEDFQDNDRIVPTILTTSQKLSTGVDAKNVRNIVLMRPVNSMIEFKQIIGRGTRTFDGKAFFTIYDFVRAAEHFKDPDWDGEPLPPDGEGGGSTNGGGSDEEEKPGGIDEPLGPGGEPPEPAPELIEVEMSDGNQRKIKYLTATSYWFGGEMISPQQFLERLFGDLGELVKDEDELRAKWSDPELRVQFLAVLSDKGYDDEKLNEMRRLIDANDSDLFDVLAYVRFNLPPLMRSERVEKVVSNDLGGYEEAMRDFLMTVLRGYEKDGVSELATTRLGQLLTIQYGSMADAKERLGTTGTIRGAFRQVQEFLYKDN